MKILNLKKEYEEKPPVVTNLIISPEIHLFVLWAHVETNEGQKNLSCRIFVAHSLKKIGSNLHSACPGDWSLNKTSMVLVLAIWDLRV